MKTRQEIWEYLAAHGLFSYNGVIDDFTFGHAREWYWVEDASNLNPFDIKLIPDNVIFHGPFDS